MKHLTLIAALAMFAIAFGGSPPQWMWHGKPIMVVSDGGSRLELGLADNGTVVWREVTQSTNSPSEQGGLFLIATNIWYTPPDGWSRQLIYTNLCITNLGVIPIYNGETNVIIKPFATDPYTLEILPTNCAVNPMTWKEVRQ